jgi:hypothetical protein
VVSIAIAGGSTPAKKSMQGAACVGKVSAVVTVVMGRALARVMAGIMDVLMMGVGGHRVRDGLRIGTRRGHDTRELGHYEHGDQQLDKAGH